LEIAKRHPGFDIYDRQAYTLKLLRSARCVHPEWTNYSDIARLDLASGRSVPAIKGRASHRASGKNWGATWIPRIGQEVIVSFLEGDLDRP
jgi:hypothetical protein